MVYNPTDGEAYYPINDKRNTALYARYKELAGQERDVVFGGRLADYTYYNMDQVIEKAIHSVLNHL